jgi:hypothetical protein
MSNGAQLPGEKPVKPLAAPFPVGSRVVMKSCPSEPGIVKGQSRGRILVRWDDLDYLGKHNPESLTLAEDR